MDGEFEAMFCIVSVIFASMADYLKTCKNRFRDQIRAMDFKLFAQYFYIR